MVLVESLSFATPLFLYLDARFCSVFAFQYYQRYMRKSKNATWHLVYKLATTLWPHHELYKPIPVLSAVRRCMYIMYDAVFPNNSIIYITHPLPATFHEVFDL